MENISLRIVKYRHEIYFNNMQCSNSCALSELIWTKEKTSQCSFFFSCFFCFLNKNVMISSREDVFIFPKVRKSTSPFTECQPVSIILGDSQNSRTYLPNLESSELAWWKKHESTIKWFLKIPSVFLDYITCWFGILDCTDFSVYFNIIPCKR